MNDSQMTVIIVHLVSFIMSDSNKMLNHGISAQFIPTFAIQITATGHFRTLQLRAELSWNPILFAVLSMSHMTILSLLFPAIYADLAEL